jgi:hypothetical protein
MSFKKILILGIIYVISFLSAYTVSNSVIYGVGDIGDSYGFPFTVKETARVCNSSCSDLEIPENAFKNFVVDILFASFVTYIAFKLPIPRRKK